MRKICTIVLVLLGAMAGEAAAQCRQIIGYYPNWQWYDRNKLVNPSTIAYSKYTIINYAFFAPQTNGSIATTDSWADENLLEGTPLWTGPVAHDSTTSLPYKAHQAGKKVVPSIGGWTLSNNFPAIAASASLRAAFAHACRQLCAQYRFDGIDIDWEYPGYVANSGTAADAANFPLFISQIRDTLTAYGNATGKTLLLTACFGASRDNMANINWTAVVPKLDYVNLMTYDFFGSWDAVANHNAPLAKPAQGDTTFNMTSAVNYLISHYNVPSTKICTGVAFYGRSAKTTGTPALFAPINGQVDNSTFSADAGTPCYYNIPAAMNQFTYHWDTVAQVPYLTGNGSLKTFVSYDDQRSIALKAQFINSKNLGGAIIWEITGDYLETSPGSGVVAGTPLLDTLRSTLCNQVMVACNIPAGITAAPAGTTAQISWGAVSGATGYAIDYKLQSAASWTTITANANAATLTGLAACTPYSYRIKTNCTSGSSSGYSAVASFTTTGCSPSSVGTVSGTRFAIYPNPAADVIRVKADMAGIRSIRIISMEGKTVASQQYAAPATDGRVYVSALSAGVYLIEVTDREGIPQTLRFVKGAVQ